jgi:hypothetical protein
MQNLRAASLRNYDNPLRQPPAHEFLVNRSDTRDASALNYNIFDKKVSHPLINLNCDVPPGSVFRCVYARGKSHFVREEP